MWYFRTSFKTDGGTMESQEDQEIQPVFDPDLISFKYQIGDSWRVVCYEPFARPQPRIPRSTPVLRYQEIVVAKEPMRPYYKLEVDGQELIVDFFIPVVAPKPRSMPTPLFSFSIKKSDEVLKVWGGLKFVNVQLLNILSYPIPLQGLAQRLDYHKTLYSSGGVQAQVMHDKVDPSKFSFKCGNVVVTADTKALTLDVWNAKLVISVRPSGLYTHNFGPSPEPEFPEQKL